MLIEYMRRIIKRTAKKPKGLAIKAYGTEINWSTIILGGRNNDKLIVKYTEKNL